MNSRLRWTVWMCAAIVLATTLSGCSGCNQDPLVKRKQELDDIDKKKEKKKRKEDFELKPTQTVPADEVAPRPLAKPGHWLTTTQEIKANNFNFSAQLHTSATDNRGAPYPVESTSYTLEGSRPAKLAKGQARMYETTYFVPREAAMPSKQVWLNRELRAARGGRLVTLPHRDPVTAMPGYQYYFVVLSSAPHRYGFLQRLTSINTPASREFEGESLLYYRVLQPEIDRFVPLPSNALTWTCVSYLLLDDLDHTRFTPPQQRALLDWLHWGGQVIISGPSSLDKLKGSFLQDYLPAQSGDSVEIDPAAIAEINAYWSLPRHPRSGSKRTLEVLPQTPMIGVELLPHQEAVPLANTANLVLERRIGQGRIVVSAFSLTDRYLMQWGASYDSFFNACLLRRPRREFTSDKQMVELFDTVWKDYRRISTKDARLITTQRYFTRDIGHYSASLKAIREPGEERSLQDIADLEAAMTGGQRITRRSAMQYRLSENEQDDVVAEAPQDLAAETPTVKDWHDDGYPPRLNYGVGAWNDRSGASDAARQSLEDASGISIPQGGFVLRVLALYLLILAPLNWGLFRLLGRVEWAWLAAPLIAIVGALVVVRTAQLDIGFARSVTEVAVAEVQGTYHRALLTRYSAMYTSLSTPYDFVFEDNAAVAQPLGDIDFKPDIGSTASKVTMHREGDLRFGGIQVNSNSIGYMHCEQHADLGGAFILSGNEMQGYRIKNETRYSLQGTGIIRGGANGRVAGAWVGSLNSGAMAPIRFEDLPSGSRQLPQWDDSLATLSYNKQARTLLERLDADHDDVIDKTEAALDPAVFEKFDRIDGASNQPSDQRWENDEIMQWCRQSRAGEVSIGQLVELACHNVALPEGEVRMVGWSDEEIPGMTIRPSAAQVKRRTLFVVHLRRAPMNPALRDVNCKADLTDEKERRLDEKDLIEEAMDVDEVEPQDDSPESTPTEGQQPTAGPAAANEQGEKKNDN